MIARVSVLVAIIAAVVAFQASTPQQSQAGATTSVSMALDCDVSTSGVQSSCTSLPGSLIDVDVVITNNTGSPFGIGNFNFIVFNTDVSRVYARDANGMDLPACDASGLNCNPDALAVVPVNNWACSPAAPDNDLNFDANPNTQESFISCLNGVGDGPTVATGGTMALARVKYRVPNSAPAGSVTLTPQDASVGDDSFVELGGCYVGTSVPMDCDSATITVLALTMSLDCNSAVAGTQSSCMVSNMLTQRDLRVNLTNHTNSPMMIAAFAVRVQNPDITRLFAPIINPPGFLNDNPNAAIVAEAPGWDCGPPGPTPDDVGTVEDGQDSYINCFTSGGTPFAVGANATVHIATVHYNVVTGADPGPVSLTITNGGASNATFNEVGSCAPVLAVAMNCPGATMTFYCPIDMADVNNDNVVNVADVGITAQNNGVLPAPAHLDQNFDGVINVADRGIVASYYFKRPSIHCP